jgi:hypothetical protein
MRTAHAATRPAGRFDRPLEGATRSLASIVAKVMVLSDRSIKEALEQGRIIIDPLGEDCIQPSSVDLHIDQFFRVFRNHTQRVIDVREAQEDLTELIDVGPDEAHDPAPR